MWSFLLPLWSFISNFPVMIFAVPIRASRLTDWHIQEHSIHFNVDENCPIGTPLGTVRSPTSTFLNDDLDHLVLHTEVKYQLGAPSSLFAVDEKTGLISTKAPIDAEELCSKARAEERQGRPTDQRTDSELLDIVDRITCLANGNLTVHADINAVRADASLVSIYQTRIHIGDLNDNLPTFDQPRWSRSLKEALYRKGRRIDLPKARDNDISPKNSQVHYRLEPYTEDVRNTFGPFKLEVNPTGQPSLLLLEDLDAELYSEYRLILFAYSPIPTDGPLDSEARLELDIQVLDMNDNEPRFSKDIYKVSVSEDTPVGSVIFQLVATDADKSASLTYGIRSSQKGLIVNSTFQVTPEGRVELTSPLDYESQRSYEVPVQVKDGEFTAYANLIVHVMDTNDEPPRFELNPKHIVASEYAPPGKLIGQLRVYDPDGEDINGDVHCFEPPGLERNQPLAFLPDPRQQPYSSVYDLTTRVFLDRESDVHAKDGRIFAYLVCADGKDWSNGHSDNRQHSSTMTITLTIRDENDHPPVFDQAIYHAHIQENNKIGEKIIQVHATDIDEGPNAQVVYSLLDRTNFEVNPVTGWISANRIFDREERDSYQPYLTDLNLPTSQCAISKEFILKALQVSVVASDRGVPQISSSVLLNLTILDQNDHAPRLIATGEHDQEASDDQCGQCITFFVYENSPANSWIGDLQAVDEDSSENAEVRFELLEDNGPLINTQFRLLRNGSFYTATILDREEKEEYVLPVLLTDNSYVSPLSSTGTVTISVRDENDNPPLFVSPKGLININHFESIQKAQGENAHWLYDQPLSDSKEIKFGQEKSVKQLERTSPQMSEDPRKKNSSTEPNTIHISVHEKRGYLITTLQATDPDKGPNGHVMYRAEEVAHRQGNSSSHFTAGRDMLWTNADLGHIVLQRELDESDLGMHIVRVTASDRSLFRPMNVSKLLILVVEDVPMLSSGAIYLNDLTATQENQALQHSPRKPLLVISLSVLAVVIAVTILTIFILYKHRQNNGKACFRSRKDHATAKSNREHVVEAIKPYTLQGLPRHTEKYNERKQASTTTLQNDKQVAKSNNEPCAHIFSKHHDELFPLGNRSDLMSTSVRFVEVETTQSANRESVQTTSVTPDLIIPKELKSNRICLSNKDSPSELNGIQGKTQNWNPYTPSSLTNTEIVTNCRNKGEQDIDKPVDLCAPFKGGFLISAQPIFEHYKQISTAEIHPLKVSFTPSGPLASMPPSEQLVAIPSVSYGVDTQHVLLATTATNPSSAFSTGDQIELINIFMNPEHVFTDSTMRVLSREENHDGHDSS